MNSNTYFRTAVPVMGYRFDFLDVLKKYLETIAECDNSHGVETEGEGSLLV